MRCYWEGLETFQIYGGIRTTFGRYGVSHLENHEHLHQNDVLYLLSKKQGLEQPDTDVLVKMNK